MTETKEFTTLCVHKGKHDDCDWEGCGCFCHDEEYQHQQTIQTVRLIALDEWSCFGTEKRVIGEGDPMYPPPEGEDESLWFGHAWRWACGYVLHEDHVGAAVWGKDKADELEKLRQWHREVHDANPSLPPAP